jgi:hypothetical protein
MDLLVKGVKHSQSNAGGTVTEITRCLRNGFGNVINTNLGTPLGQGGIGAR